jgi:hypothetical protein
VDDFNKAKRRLYWYFKYSLVSTLKEKFKLGSRKKVFDRYTNGLKCIDSRGKEVCFTTDSYIDNLKRDFLINKIVEDPNKFLNRI